MAKKEEYRMQISMKFADEAIILGRGDDQDELKNSLEDALFVYGQNIPKPTYEPAEQSQDPEDVPVCPIHNEKMMQEGQTKDGRKYRFHLTSEPAYQYKDFDPPWKCFGSPPKSSG
jgi:hypothetical protein